MTTDQIQQTEWVRLPTKRARASYVHAMAWVEDAHGLKDVKQVEVRLEIDDADWSDLQRESVELEGQILAEAEIARLREAFVAVHIQDEPPNGWCHLIGKSDE